MLIMLIVVMRVIEAVEWVVVTAVQRAQILC